MWNFVGALEGNVGLHLFLGSQFGTSLQALRVAQVPPDTKQYETAISQPSG